MNENMNNNNTIPRFESGYKIDGWARAARVDPDGTVTWQDKWTHNILLNAGMNTLATTRFARLMYYGTAATGSRANKFDSGGSQVSQSGTLLGLSGSGTMTDWSVGVTGYAATLQSGDVIQLADGTQVLIDTVNNGTTATSHTSSATIAPQTFTIYKTSQTNLQGPRVLSTGYTAGGSGATQIRNTTTLWHTYDFAAETINKVYSEVGVATQPQNQMSRILLDTPITIPVGSQLRLQVAMAISIYPSASVYYPNDMITGWPGSGGTASVQAMRFEYFDSNGVIPDNRNFPSEIAEGNNVAGFISRSTGSVQEPLVTGATPIDRTETIGNNVYRIGANTTPAYITNNFYIERTSSYGTSVGSSSIYRSLGWGNFENYGNPGGTSYIGWAYLMNNSQSKSDLQTLAFYWRINWARTLV